MKITAQNMKKTYQNKANTKREIFLTTLFTLSTQTYLHCERFSASGLSISKYTHVITIDARDDKGFNLLKNLPKDK